MPIMSCDCPSAMQDKLHGSTRRVFNKTAKDKTYRCTVCNKEKTTGNPDAKTSGKK